MKTTAKDNLSLLLWALICSGSAWAYWHFSGEYGFAVLTIVALLGLVADNYRLRKLLRRAS